MTDKELEELTCDLKDFLQRQKGRSPRKKGLFSKAIVCVCLLLIVGYTAACLYMQYRTGTQPEPQLTIAFFGFVTAELWNLAKIKRGEKNENRTEKHS